MPPASPHLCLSCHLPRFFTRSRFFIFDGGLHQHVNTSTRQHVRISDNLTNDKKDSNDANTRHPFRISIYCFILNTCPPFLILSFLCEPIQFFVFEYCPIPDNQCRNGQALISTKYIYFNQLYASLMWCYARFDCFTSVFHSVNPASDHTYYESPPPIIGSFQQSRANYVVTSRYRH